jgi:hypothetical protein
MNIPDRYEYLFCSWIILHMLIERMYGFGIFAAYRLIQYLPVKQHIICYNDPFLT